MENDVQLKVIAALMSEKLRKERNIYPITAKDVVKMPNNYCLDSRVKEVYVALVNSNIVMATVWTKGDITVKVSRGFC